MLFTRNYNCLKWVIENEFEKRNVNARFMCPLSFQQEYLKGNLFYE